MKRLDAYVLTRFLGLLLLALSAFTGLYLLIDFFEKIDDLLGTPLTMIDMVLFFVAKVPMIVQQVLPLATLMAVFLTLGQLSRSSELTAMRAAGVSLGRIASPLLFCGLALGGVVLLLGEYVTPVFSLKTAALWQKSRADQQRQGQVSSQNLWLRTGEGILHIRQTLPRQQRLEGMTLFVLDDSARVDQRIDAEAATYEDGHWLWQNPRGLHFDQDGTARPMINISEQVPHLDRTPRDFQRDDLDDVQHSLRTLYRQQQRQQREGLPSRRLAVDLQARLAEPAACLIMAFLGVPFALQSGRKSGLALGLAISVVTGMTYFVLNALFVATGYAGSLPPFVAAWCTNLLFLLFGVWLLLNVRQ